MSAIGLPPSTVRKLALSVAAALLLTACTHVPFDAPRSEAEPLRPPGPTRATREISREIARNDGRSGFIPLVNGNDALGARLSMIEAAEHRIDMQSFLIKPDKAGSLISLALMEAADRGVAVRLLFDDVFTTASDRQFALLASHPRIDVRLFNPLSRRSTTTMNYLLDFRRVNRRMHNKVFVVDDAMAIVGGRNVADEYYQIGTESEFADFDLFVAGPVVSDLSQAFDLYWSDDWSVPVEALRRQQEAVDVAQVEAELTARAATAAAGIYERAMGSTYLADVRQGRIQMVPGDARVVIDPPAKLKVPPLEGERDLADALIGRIAMARRQVTILTPYFVPEDWGAHLFEQLARRGVQVRIVTNSLAANNHAYVHAGYMRHRKALLAAGVELYEVRADAPEVLGQGPPGSRMRLTMHTKLAMIDDETTFVGSLNFDPRSIRLNTELGLFIDDRRITEGFQRAVDDDLSRYTFRMSLDPAGDLLWNFDYHGLHQVYRSEPGAGAGKKAISRLTRLLPVEGQL
jgi:cardiolipin synthase C